MRNFIVLAFIIFASSRIYAVTNLFTNAVGDSLWSTPGNWSLGVLPNSTNDVTVSAAVTLIKIPAGHIANCKIFWGAKHLRIVAGGTLIVWEKINLQNADYLLTNNGKLILKPGNDGITLSLGGRLTNNEGDSLIIQSPNGGNAGIFNNGGVVTNRGIIHIYNTSGFPIWLENLGGWPGKFINKSSGTILINDGKTSGITVRDSLINEGSIFINDIQPNSPIPSSGIDLVSFGRLKNYGLIDIDDIGSRGIWNDGGVLTNEAEGSIVIHDFVTEGFYNAGITYNYGDLEINGTSNTSNNKAIYLYGGTFGFKSGSHTTITGNNQVDYGIAGTANFTNDTLSTINFHQLNQNGIYLTGYGMTNRGTINIYDGTTQYFTGIEEINSNFNNYGLIYANNCYAGVRVLTTYDANNYGSMIFRNMSNHGINSNGKFHNRSGSSLLCYSDNGIFAGTGIFHAGEGNNSAFINDGAILVDSLYTGIDFRSGNFSNNGSLTLINNRWGIEFGSFSESAIFTNNGIVTINYQNNPAAAAINIESNYNNVYNFVNTTSGELNFNHCGLGIRMFNGGFKNEGDINFNDIEAKAIYLIPTNINNYHFKNFSTGVIDIDTSAYGVFFEIITAGTNRIPFINDGIVKLNHIANEAIDGPNAYDGFTNNGSVYGTCLIDCQFNSIEGNYLPGGNLIGAIQFNNYATTNPTFKIQMKGNAGPGVNNGHDLIYVTSNIALNGTLEVSTLAGFNPSIGNEYLILLSTGTVTSTFTTVILPNFSSTMEFEVLYQTDRVKLKVIPKYVNWTGNTNSNWNNVGNWSSGVVPTITTDVRINSATNQPVIASGLFSIGNSTGSPNFLCKSLVVNTGATITFNDTVVENYSSLQVKGTLTHNRTTAGTVTNKPGSTANIETGASLILNVN